MANKIAKAWPLITLAVWAVFGVIFALDPVSCKGAERSIFWLGIGVLLLLLNLGLILFRSTRATALVSVLLLVVFVSGHFWIKVNRLDYGRKQIEAVYTAVAKQGPPFPDKLDVVSLTVPGYMEWYYQKHSAEKFAVVYLVCSDGWAMEYPSAQWQFIGYCPDGYVPLAETNRDPVDPKGIDSLIHTTPTNSGPNNAMQPTSTSKAN